MAALSANLACSGCGLLLRLVFVNTAKHIAFGLDVWDVKSLANTVYIRAKFEFPFVHSWKSTSTKYYTVVLHRLTE